MGTLGKVQEVEADGTALIQFHRVAFSQHVFPTSINWEGRSTPFFKECEEFSFGPHTNFEGCEELSFDSWIKLLLILVICISSGLIAVYSLV